MARAGMSMVEIRWYANPFRGDRFAEMWAPAAEAALRYGASEYALIRSKDDPLQFTQLAFFEDKLDFDRYWYSQEISDARMAISGYFQVPVLPVWKEVVDAGVVVSEAAAER